MTDKRYAYLKCVDRSTNTDKFYEMAEGPSAGMLSVRYGRVGTEGTTLLNHKPISDWNKIYNSKCRKGYLDYTTSHPHSKIGVDAFHDVNANKKYKMTGVRKNVNGHNVYRIEAARRIELVNGQYVEVGDQGGWVETPDNLSQKGDCWVDENAVVYGLGRVSENACAMGCSLIEGLITGNAVVAGEARIAPSGLVKGNSIVTDNTEVWGELLTDVCVRGHSVIQKNVHIASKCDIFDKSISSAKEVELFAQML